MKYIKEVKEKYQKVKATYQTKGQLLPYKEDNPQDFLDSLGGEMWYGNWTETAPIPSAFEISISESIHEEPGDGILITHKGKKFMCVAEVAGYNYCDGADSILMFYEPESKIVLFTYDWT